MPPAALLVCAAILLGQTPSPPSPASASVPAASSRLDRAEARLRELAEANAIPGVAYALLVGDQLRLGAFGVSGAGLDDPLRVDTRFDLGSGTEPFTSVLTAMLVEDGTVWWDEPAARLVPGFTMVDPAAAQSTLRDLLCHRTGVMRTDLAWIADPPAADILAAFGRAKPTAAFRTTHQEESTGYVVLGLALAGAVASTERPVKAPLVDPAAWETLLRTRLTGPLGMTATTSAGKGDARVAHGAVRELDGDAGGAWRLVPQRPTTHAAPAVGLASTATDLGRWLRFLVGRGKVDDTRLVSIERMEELWRPELALNAAASPNIAGGAAMGFDIFSVDGHRVVRHDGGSEGLRVCTAVMPDDGAGYILLANAAPSGLARRAERLLCPELLGIATSAPPAREPTTATAPLVGRYRSTVLGTDLVLRDVGGQIEVVVGDGGAWDLMPPDASGARAVVGAPDVTFSFPVDADGVVRRLRLVQTGMPFECLRVDLPPLPVDPALRPFTGLFLDATRGGNVAIMAGPGGRLLLAPRGQPGAAAAPVLEFQPSEEPDRWIMVGLPGPFLKFQRSPDGRVTAVTMRGGEGLRDLARVSDLTPEGAGFAPALEVVLARHRQGLGAAGTAVRRAAGKLRFLNQGVDGQAEIVADAQGLLVSMDLGAAGTVRVECRSGASRIDAPFDGPRALSPMGADLWRLAFSPEPPTTWLPDTAFLSAGVEGPSEHPGLRLHLRTPAGATAILVLDANTLRAQRLETELAWGALGAGPIVLRYDGPKAGASPTGGEGTGQLQWAAAPLGRIELHP